MTIPCSPQQHSDSDSEPEFSSLSPSIPSAIPVTGESYCNCENQSEAPYCSSLHALHRVRDCRCGEEDECKGLGMGELLQGPVLAPAFLCCTSRGCRRITSPCLLSCSQGSGLSCDGVSTHLWDLLSDPA